MYRAVNEQPSLMVSITVRCVKDIVGVSDWSLCVEASDIRLLLRTEDTDRAKQCWQENATSSRNRTEATSLLEMAHALGSQAASLENDSEEPRQERPSFRGGRERNVVSSCRNRDPG
jgi:hypothetical protein